MQCRTENIKLKDGVKWSNFKPESIKFFYIRILGMKFENRKLKKKNKMNSPELSYRFTCFRKQHLSRVPYFQFRSNTIASNFQHCFPDLLSNLKGVAFNLVVKKCLNEC
jgi:hypothetical protein